MPRVAFGGIQKLASNEARKEEGVDSQSDNLEWRGNQSESPSLVAYSKRQSGQVERKVTRVVFDTWV